MYVVDPQSLVNRAKSIKGIDKVVDVKSLPKHLNLAIEVVEDWSDAEEIGSSDFTFMLKEFIDLILQVQDKYDVYQTSITPYLSVVEK